MAELEEGDDESDENTTKNSSSDFELVSKKNTKALVWKYFGFEVDANGQPLSMEAPKCRLCYNNVAVKDSNATNLHSHLKHKHPEEYSLVQRASEKGRKKEKAPDPNQPSLTATWDKQKLLLMSSREHKQLTKSVANCLAKDMLPLSTVDKPGFRAKLYKFNPRFQLPTRKHFTKVAIPSLVSQV